MKKFSLITILTAKTPDLFWGVVKFLKEEAKELGEEALAIYLSMQVKESKKWKREIEELREAFAQMQP